MSQPPMSQAPPPYSPPDAREDRTRGALRTQDPPANVPRHQFLDVSFDGGFRGGVAASAAAISESEKLVERHQTGQTSYKAEVLGAALALTLACEHAMARPEITHIRIRGDNMSVISQAAIGAVELYARPGRSAAPAQWARFIKARQDFDTRMRDRAITLEWRHTPRKYNGLADALCTAAITGADPVFPEVPPLPVSPPGPPTIEGMQQIWNAASSNAAVRSIRSIPPYLKPLWHACIGHICVQWPADVATRALIVAPRVLLERTGGDIRTRLSWLASRPGAIEIEYAHAAERLTEAAKHDDRPQRTEAEREKHQQHLIDRTAHQEAARAVRMAEQSQPLLTMADKWPLDNVRAIAGKPTDNHFDTAPQLKTPRDEYATASKVILVVARQISRLAAPGLDGWTRELLLSSFCKPSAVKWEHVFKMMLDGEFTKDDSVLRDARIAMWRKAPGVNKARVIGMTSCLTKVAWRIACARHLYAFTPPKMQHMFNRGGIQSVLHALANDKPRYMADVVDAYWGVDRVRCATYLSEKGSPLYLMFRFIYGAPPSCVWETMRIALHRGVLPGCAGAALTFAIDIQLALGPDVDGTVMMFADDVCAGTPEALATVVNALDPDKLDKFVVVDPAGELGAEVQIGPRRVKTTRAAKHLGGFVGDPTEAGKLLREHVMSKLRTLRKILEMEYVGLQAKWAMFNVVERALAWTFAATDPTVSAEVAPETDDMIWSLFCAAFLPEVQSPSALTRPLFHLNTADGGLGVTNFTVDARTLWDAAGLSAGPLDRTDEGDDGIEAARITPAKLKRAVRDDRLKQFKSLAKVGRPFLAAQADKQQWFDIRAITCKHRITDAAFRTMMAIQLEVDDKAWPTCGISDGATHRDHVQSDCASCAKPYFLARHEQLAYAFLGACRQHGVVASTNFTQIGIPSYERHKPDALVMRASERLPPLVLDFTVVHQTLTSGKNPGKQTRLDVRYREKVDKYKKQCESCGAEMAPVVFSTKAALHPESRAALEGLDSVADGRGFARDAIARMKVVFVNYTHMHQRSLAGRKAAGRLISAGPPVRRTRRKDDSNDGDADGDGTNEGTQDDTRDV